MQIDRILPPGTTPMAPRAFLEALKLLLLLSISLFTTFSICSPTTPRIKRLALDDGTQDQKQQDGLFSVLGVAGLTGPESHPRLEIRELEKNEDQWNVYLIGLRRFQSVDSNDKLSYYQVSGIHGRPYISWDSVEKGNGGSGGYCTHGSNIFPTWHRPYLALFEEALYLYAQQVVSEFPAGELKNRYRDALATLRMPYWDWAAVPASGQGSLPASVQSPTIDVILPNGTTTIPNPLFSYPFHPLNPNNDFDSTPWTTWPSTLRDPSSNDANAASRNDLVAIQLDANRPSLQSRVYNVLGMQHDYKDISNDLQPGDSLESVHDTIHNTVGSDGHMSMLAYSSFDPIFWLHHTNVDRLFAMWQFLNPDSYVTKMENPYATFTYEGGFTADEKTNLTPFHRDDAGLFWTSEDIRDTKVFAYTYPELVDLGDKGKETLIAKIKALYGPDATPQNRSKEDDVQLSKRDSARIAGAPNFSGKRQYIANIKVHKFGLDGSFSVYVFLGDECGSDAKAWMTDSSFVGSVGMLSQAGVAAADTQKLNQVANGVVPLTAALEAKVRCGELESMHEEVVTKYLKGRLRWRISKMNGKELSVDHTPGFQIAVLWAEVVPAACADEFPKMKGEYQVLANATSERVGGFREGDTLN